MHKAFFKYASYATLGLAGLLIATLVFWGVYPYKGLEFKEVPVPLEESSVRAGQQVSLLADYCNYFSGKRRTIVRMIGDGKEVILSNTTVENSPVGCDSVTYHVRVPKATAAGAYIIRFSNTYYFNPIRTSDQEETDSLPFVVIE